ncbi:hypothetical protein J4573_44495 [Actinomadura barringtoniae]|uniref:SlyX family protein n=1 Tax=Actinomadura barringtoniae TaxID=1427535 RepID=A0A939PJT3_9ACTN|nr:hypothetical protein [Actinomadura barringtoniae]MBO2454212.1 hypothetical protein [Actinomadura barringtoniae]
MKEHRIAAGNAELEMRVKALETRVGRHEDDMTSLVDTSSETLKRVTRIEKGLDALLAHHGIEVEVDQDEDDLVEDE